MCFVMTLLLRLLFIESLAYVDFIDKSCVSRVVEMLIIFYFVDKPPIFGVVKMLMVVDFGYFCETHQRGRMAIGLFLFV